MYRPSTSSEHLLDHGPHDQDADTMGRPELADEVGPSRNHGGFGVRHFQAFLSFGGLMVAFILRLNLSVAVVGMETSQDYKVVLTPKTKALVLSSMFWGYGLLQVTSGAIGRRGHGVKLFALGNFGAGILSLMIPFAALNFGYVGICLLRFIIGLVQGNVYPNLNNVMANWAIPQEKDAIMCIVQAGAGLGSLISMSASGYLGYNFGWPSIFYASGLVGIIWGIIHAVFGGEDPDSYKKISNEEQEYMRICFQAENKQVEEIKANVPWKKIITSPPVLVLTITCCCAAWTGWTIVTLTPTYINGVLGYNLHDNGLLSALPYLFSCITSVLLTVISWHIKKKTRIPESFLRPFWNSIAMYGTCASLLVLAYAPISTALAETMLVIAQSVAAAGNLGMYTNCLDLSPNFAGIIMSISNSTANIASILGPLISTYLVQDTSDIYEWRIVFTVSAMLCFFGNSIFIFWGSTKKQPWDTEEGPANETC